MKGNKWKKYLNSRLNKWGSRWKLYADLNTNRKANWLILAAETIVVIWLLASVVGCPCSYRTCGIRHLDVENRVDWEAYNLDCDYVENYTAAGRQTYKINLSK
jgi:hypothetical protein